MKRSCFLVMALISLSGLCSAQVSSEPAAPSQDSSAKAQNSGAVPSGAILSAELSKSLDAKKCKSNDRIEAKTATDLLQHGQIVVPRNTKIIGHVTEAKTHSKTSPDSVVGITFDRMLLKDGREVPLQLSVQAIGRPLQVWNSPAGYGAAADNSASTSATMPGQRSPLGTNSGASVSSPYPSAGDPATPPEPVESNTSTVSPLSPTSRGVIGLKALSMNTAGPVSVFSSNTGNVHLDGGTQLILVVQ
jgi:hypothetical protein